MKDKQPVLMDYEIKALRKVAANLEKITGKDREILLELAKRAEEQLSTVDIGGADRD